MMKLNHKPCSPFILFFTVLLITFNTTAEEILFSDDFQSGEIGDEWTFYGDPVSVINSDNGNPAPCFNNNGDSMWPSGIKSRQTFSIKDGLVIQCDIFLSCHPRGAWVGSSFGIHDPSLTSGNNEPKIVANMSYSYYGELNWNRPHLQGILTMSVSRLYRNETNPELIHMNQWLDCWHTFKIEVSPEGLCSWFVNDSLVSSNQASFPDSMGEVGIFLEGRATSWGTALHDNLLVYVP
ncbi:MAG: hypothetical protein KAS73_11075 [Candidatus Sabulitectum sp.]|nr:hypothetical protein [Candidatus Sabulitectum sp.]